MSAPRRGGWRAWRAWRAVLASPPVLTALVSAVVALALLQFRYVESRDRLRLSVSAIDNAAQARRFVARAYLVIEGVAAGDATFSRPDAAAALDRAVLAVDDWLAGRSAALGTARARRSDPALERQVRSYGERIRAFRALLDDPRRAPAPVDVRVAFGTLEAQADSIEYRVAATLAAAAAREERDHALTVFALMLFIVLAGGLLHRLDAHRTRAEQALAATEARFRLLLEGLPAMVWTTDAELRATSITGGGLTLLGGTPEGVIGRALPDMAEANSAADALAAHRRALGGESGAYLATIAGRHLEARVETERDASGAIVGTIGVALDVTERHGFEAQLRKAQKLEALGRLAAGVAHDFNNLLMVVLSTAEFLRQDLPAGTRQREDLDAITDAATRGARLTRQLLAFSRQQPQDPRRIDLGAVVRDIEPMLCRLVGSHIEVRVATAPDAWIVADPSQMEQVLMNLAINARDAMPDDGVLALTVDQGERHVRLRVRDTGHGMDEATRERIFEPFFTTKGPERGTGLGLATVHGVVQQAGGTIDLESAPQKGTTFTIQFPRA